MIHAYHALKHWFLYGDIYQLTSGPIIVGGLVAIFRRHTCHARRCWRFAHHPVEGTPYTVCRKHHPSIPNRGASAEEIAAHHTQAKAGAVKVREGA